MSEQTTKALLDRMKADAAFRDKVLAGSTPEDRLALIRAEGYDCALDEIQSLGGALADAALDAVAGGLWDVCSSNTCGAHCTAHGG